MCHMDTGYGQVHNEYIVARCKYSECKMNNAPCPPGIQNGNDYFLLNGTQCLNGRGGELCRKCADKFVFSFLSIQKRKLYFIKRCCYFIFLISYQILISPRSMNS